MKTKTKKRAAIEAPQLYTYPGVCSVCGCTQQDGCPEGCEWVNREHTLCSVCDPLSAEQRHERRLEAVAELSQRANEAAYELQQAAAHLDDVSRRLAALASFRVGH